MIAKYTITPIAMDIKTLKIPLGFMIWTLIPMIADAMTIFIISLMLNGSLIVFLLAKAVTLNARI